MSSGVNPISSIPINSTVAVSQSRTCDALICTNFACESKNVQTVESSVVPW